MSGRLTTSTISTLFADAIQRQSGSVLETIDTGALLFSRSLLPFVQEVRRSDRLQGGIALKATESEIWLHPYLFREICSNGAILAQSLSSWHVDYSEFASDDEVCHSLEEAVAVCSDKGVFVEAVQAMRTSTHTNVDIALMLLPILSRQLAFDRSRETTTEILERFLEDDERTRFSLMNAVTAVARDTRDQEQRWRLEELGGAIGAGIVPEAPRDFDGVFAGDEELIGTV